MRGQAAKEPGGRVGASVSRRLGYVSVYKKSCLSQIAMGLLSI